MLTLYVAMLGLALAVAGCGRLGQTATGTDARETEVVVIPDGDREGIVLGPIIIASDGGDLGPVTLRLDIYHPAPGDLDVRLAYDADCDGMPEERAPVEFFRSRSSVEGSELHACPASLQGSYFFRDASPGEEPVFAVFNDLARGGGFYLMVSDTLAGDEGCVLGWSVTPPARDRQAVARRRGPESSVAVVEGL